MEMFVVYVDVKTNHMNNYTFLFCLLFFAGTLQAQGSKDVAACLRASLSVPDMATAFTQEWGELRPLYLRKRAVPGIGERPADEGVNQLTAADFEGLPWVVIPLTEEEIQQLPAEEVQFGILEAGIGFRDGQAAANLFISLPLYPRRWMAASFLLGKEGGEWSVLQQSIEMRP